MWWHAALHYFQIFSRTCLFVYYNAGEKRFVVGWDETSWNWMTKKQSFFQLSKVSLPFITIGDSQITPSSQAQNLGVIFDSTMTLNLIISNIVRVSSFHIRNISRIRKYLNQSAAEQITCIHALVTSRLDNGNGPGVIGFFCRGSETLESSSN